MCYLGIVQQWNSHWTIPTCFAYSFYSSFSTIFTRFFSLFSSNFSHSLISLATARACSVSASTLALNSSSASGSYAPRLQSMVIQDIPPFRKKSSDSADHTGSSTGSSPQRSSMRNLQLQQQHQQQQQLAQQQQQSAKIAEIPPYTRTRKISAESTTHLQMSVSQSGFYLTTPLTQLLPIYTHT